MTLPRLKLALASKSPARLATLRSAHIDPVVQVSEVDEDAILDSLVSHGAGASQQVLALATAKARAVAADPVQAADADIILGCDSMFELDGEIVGKPHTPEIARERLRKMAGRAGILHTGHHLIHTGSGAPLGAVSHAVVHFAEMTDAEIDAYIATDEPLKVAGSFTVDGRGGPFIDHIEGDYHGVVGISLPLLRKMLRNWDLSITQFWENPAQATVSERAAHILSKDPVFSPKSGADGFILCSCGQEHWGLNGASGILAFRETPNGVEVLAQLRATWSDNGGTWSNPGGAIGWEESPLDGALREYAEETGIGAGQLDVVGQHVRDHGDWAYTTFLARCSQEPRGNRESDELRWVSLDALLEAGLGQPVHPAFAADLPALAAMIREECARA